jgi:hypothetical protein
MARAFYADMGKIGYGKMMELKAHLAEMRVLGNIPDVFLFAEHEPTILMNNEDVFSENVMNISKKSGIRPADHMKALEIAVHEENVENPVFLGPGQLSVYPVVAGEFAAGDVVSGALKDVSAMNGEVATLCADSFHLHVVEGCTDNYSLLNHGRKLGSIEADIADAKKAVLKSISMVMNYDRLEECEISINDGIVSVKKI